MLLIIAIIAALVAIACTIKAAKKAVSSVTSGSVEEGFGRLAKAGGLAIAAYFSWFVAVVAFVGWVLTLVF